VAKYVITPHAAYEKSRRGLDEVVVRQVLRAPEQCAVGRPGRVLLQSRMGFGDPPEEFLIRVFVEIDRDPAEVGTAYRASKLEKYWRRDESG
jgi:hypothetical protein